MISPLPCPPARFSEEQVLVTRFGDSASQAAAVFTAWGDADPAGPAADAAPVGGGGGADEEGSAAAADECARVKAAMAAGRAVTTCVRSRRRDGRSFWNFAHLEPVLAVGGVGSCGY
jgi:hypothetical protein